MDWDGVEREAVDLLSEYIRINTTNPPGNERAAVEFLGRFLEEEGLKVVYRAKDPERPNLICRLESGRDRKGLMLLHHCDVVGANSDEWTVPPFGGVVKDGYVWGRGALDMKGMGVMEIMALVLAHREGLSLARDLLLVVTSDEESGSGHGAEFLAKEHPQEVEAAWALNEGGSGWRMGDRNAILCGFGEKGPLWVRLTAEGRSGHGSVPHGDNPCERLVEGIQALLSIPRPLRILPQMRGFLAGIGMEDASAEEFSESSFLQIPNVRAMFQDTLSLTMLQAGGRPNVIPDRAQATLDCRILPDRSTQEVLEEMRKALPSDSLKLEPIMAIEASTSPLEDPFYQCLRGLAERFFPEIPFLPSICPGFTDSRCFRRLGTRCYGWLPALVDVGDLIRMHGKDERIRIEDLVMGIRVIYEMIREMCMEP
jgi:acetylornithine deacetylase/succinyl-diaminopimelate desuccinylase-like protein